MSPRPRRPGPVRRALGTALAGLVLIAAAGRPAGAQVFEVVGTRALGMGGAFVAVADDATANYWNPAGLADLFFSALVDVQRLDTRLDPDPRRQSGSRELGTMVSMASPTLGLSYYRLRSWAVTRTDDVASLRSVVAQHLAATLVQPVAPGVTVATAIKVVRGTAGAAVADGGAPVGVLADQASMLDGRTTNRFDLDVGVMAGAGPLRLALVARNLREPAFAASDDVTVTLRRQFRAGVSMQPTDSLVLALDADLSTTETAAGPRRMIAVGAEQELGGITVRAGGRLNTARDDPEPVGSVGLSVEVISGLWLDGQMTGGRADGDSGWALSTRVGF